MPIETCSRLGRKPRPLFDLLSVREKDIRRRRWRNNAGRSCAVPIGDRRGQGSAPATGAGLARGQLLASFSFREQEQVSWRSVFCSVFPRFLKQNKTDHPFRFPGVLSKVFNSTGQKSIFFRMWVIWPQKHEKYFLRKFGVRERTLLYIAAPRAPMRTLLQSYSANKQREPRRSVFQVL